MVVMVSRASRRHRSNGRKAAALAGPCSISMCSGRRCAAPAPARRPSTASFAGAGGQHEAAGMQAQCPPRARDGGHVEHRLRRGHAPRRPSPAARVAAIPRAQPRRVRPHRLRGEEVDEVGAPPLRQPEELCRHEPRRAQVQLALPGQAAPPQRRHVRQAPAPRGRASGRGRISARLHDAPALRRSAGAERRGREQHRGIALGAQPRQRPQAGRCRREHDDVDASLADRGTAAISRSVADGPAGAVAVIGPYWVVRV